MPRPTYIIEIRTEEGVTHDEIARLLDDIATDLWRAGLPEGSDIYYYQEDHILANCRYEGET